jgi:tRNA (guanosine-2'-O-)-methyltransferase
MSARQLGSTELKRLHRGWRRRNENRLALLFDDVANPYNVGAISRSAASFSVDHLYLTAGSVNPRAPKAAKTGLGTEKYLTWTDFPTVGEAAKAARDDGYLVVAVELADTAAPLASLDLDRDVCLMLGHEDRGVSPAGLECCDAVGFIPLLGRVGSLNVATAAAIACYEVRRQGFGPEDVTGEPSAE